MADPYADYLATLGITAGPGLNPGFAPTREQAGLAGLFKTPEPMDASMMMYPGGHPDIPTGPGPIAQAQYDKWQNFSDLGHGIPTYMNSAGTGYDPAKVVQAVKDLVLGGIGLSPKNAAGSFGGHLAEGWSREASDKYADMLRQGYTPQDAFKETNLFRTADNRLKFEIPDTASSLTNKATNELMRYGPDTTISGNLSDFLIHPQLYENYPGMKNLPTSISLVPPKPSGQMNYSGVYRPGSQSLAANSSYIEGPEGIQSILMHEAGGHHIQELENFAKGSSPQAEREIGENLMEKLAYERLFERMKPNPDLNKIARLEAMHKEFNQSFNPFDAYQRSAGEVDARAIQARMMMTPAGLRAISPADTAAGLVPFNRQIVRFD